MFVKMLMTVVLLLGTTTVANAQYPDGTLVLSQSRGLIGRIAKRITGDHYTHIGIVIDGKIYESDWPRTKRSPIRGYGRRKATYDFYVPNTPYSSHEVARMRSYATSKLGQPYQLRNYFRPGTRPTKGTWCSPFVGKVLNSSGRHRLSTGQSWEPQNVINTLRSQHHFSGRIGR